MNMASHIAILAIGTSRLRPDGTVKVLDFGLATALQPEAEVREDIVPAEAPHAETLPPNPDRVSEGLILGITRIC